MSVGAAPSRPASVSAWRCVAAAVGLGIAVVACLPVLLGIGSGGELATALLFAAMAIAAPALVVIGAPWGRLDVRWPLRAAIDRRAARRSGRSGTLRAGLALGAELAVLVAWRTPALVDGVVRHPALVVLESATLMCAGVAFWLELVDAPPFCGSASRPRRALLAALAMWTIWTLAYLEAMSSSGWYHAFRHAPGVGLSAAADRQVAAVVLWSAAAVAFLPVVFWNLAQWLRTEGALSGRPVLVHAAGGEAASLQPRP